MLTEINFTLRITLHKRIDVNVDINSSSQRNGRMAKA